MHLRSQMSTRSFFLKTHTHTHTIQVLLDHECICALYEALQKNSNTAQPTNSTEQSW